MNRPISGSVAIALLLASAPAIAQDHSHVDQGSDAPSDAATGQTAPSPPVPSDHAADAIWGADAMAPSRTALSREHGGMAMGQVMLDIAEVQFRRGREGYRWESEGWWGGDVNRFTLKSEGEGRYGQKIEAAEVQALYSRAIGPYYNLQAGVRQDIATGPNRTYAAIGVEGLAPYWFETEATLFLSDKGDVTARAEAWYDQRITQRLILQPRGEANFAAQNVPEQGIGRGITNVEAGLRLRYEIAREFAPYLGVSWERKLGRSATYARADGEDIGGVAFVLGIRAWF